MIYYKDIPSYRLKLYAFLFSALFAVSWTLFLDARLAQDWLIPWGLPVLFLLGLRVIQLGWKHSATTYNWHRLGIAAIELCAASIAMLSTYAIAKPLWTTYAKHLSSGWTGTLGTLAFVWLLFIIFSKITSICFGLLGYRYRTPRTESYIG